MAEPAHIEMLHVHKTYGRVTALWDVSLRIEPGAFVFVNGPSGAGKSTLLSLLACLERPSQGQIFIGQTDLSQLKPAQVPALRRRIGVVFQDFKLLNDRSVFDNVALPLEIWNWPPERIRKRVATVLELVGLSQRAGQRPQTLSGGEQQRAALARAVVAEPQIVLADEPTGNLDPDLAKEVIQLLELINRKGTTVVVATHDRQLVRSVPAGMLSLAGGRVVGVEV